MDCSKAVPMFRALTFTPAMGLPAGSFMVPVKKPLMAEACPKSRGAGASKKTREAKRVIHHYDAFKMF